MHHIKNPKFSEKGISFNSNGNFMALVERKSTKDYIGIYSTADWKLVNVRTLHKYFILIVFQSRYK